MNTGTFVSDSLLTPLAAGVFGVATMELIMWLLTRTGWARGNMIVAVGGLLTGKRDNAFRVGLALHLLAGFTIPCSMPGLCVQPS